MPKNVRSITAEDIIPLDEYAVIRKDRKREAIENKKRSRLNIGPNAVIMFESWDSMWLQIQEMLWIEKGGDDQLVDELAAYEPMVPNGSELTATVLFEVADPVQRDVFLRQIGGVEDFISIKIGEQEIKARAEGDVVRTRERDGKTSAVHFFHFDFSPEAVHDWKDGGSDAMVVISHPNYGHAALIGQATRDFLSRECF